MFYIRSCLAHFINYGPFIKNKDLEINDFDVFLVELSSPRWETISKFNSIVCYKSLTVTYHVLSL